MSYEITKRPSLTTAIPSFLAGITVALILKKSLNLSFQDALITYKLAYGICLPLMLAGAYAYQSKNKVTEAFGLLLMSLAMISFGMVCFYLFTIF